jgi:hypothetical protein
MLRRDSDARVQRDPWSTALQRWGVQKTIPFQALDFINVRVDDYRVTSGEVNAIRSEFDITDKICETPRVRLRSCPVAPYSGWEFLV